MSDIIDSTDSLPSASYLLRYSPGEYKLSLKSRARIQIWGGGGAGGGGWTSSTQNLDAGGGGGGGGYSLAVIDYLGTISLVIGKGGAPKQGAGGNGGDSFVVIEEQIVAQATGGTGGIPYGDRANINCDGFGLPGKGDINGGHGIPGLLAQAYLQGKVIAPNYRSGSTRYYLGEIGKGGDSPNGGFGGLGAWNDQGQPGGAPGGGGGGGTSALGAKGGDGFILVELLPRV